MERLAIDPWGRVASWAEDGTIRVWDLEARREIHRSRFDSVVAGLAFDEKGERLAIALDDGEIRLVNVDSGARIKAYSTGARRFDGVLRFERNRQRLWMKTKEGVGVIDLGSGELAMLEGTGMHASCLALDEVRSCLAVGELDWIMEFDLTSGPPNVEVPCVR